jgi:hypothetical protein
MSNVCKTPIVKVDRNKNVTLNRCPKGSYEYDFSFVFHINIPQRVLSIETCEKLTDNTDDMSFQNNYNGDILLINY